MTNLHAQRTRGRARVHACLLVGLIATSLGCKGRGDGGDTLDTDGTDDSAESGGVDDTTGGDIEMEDDAVYLTEVEHLVRISMALRGTRPSLAQLDAVAADPSALPGIVDEYLEDPAMGQMLRDMHNDLYLLEPEVFEFPALPPLTGEEPAELAAEAMQGPLRLAEHVVMNDRPYTEMVTGDYWMVSERSAAIWGVDHDPQGPAWQPVPIPDGRGAAGLLSDNALFVRYESNGINLNRGRANVLSRALLCHDFLDADIDVSGGIDLSDPESVANAAQEVAACASCHQTLDPIAGGLRGYPGFLDYEEIEQYPVVDTYAMEPLDEWEYYGGQAPGYFGQSIETLGDLGQAIADDPRFSLCTATRFYAYLLQTPLADVPHPEASRLQEVLIDSSFDAKSLIREIVLSDDFRRIEGPDVDDPGLSRGYLRGRPFQLSRLVEDLTGYRWYFDDGAQLHSLPHASLLGFEVLGGGHDSFFTTQASTTVDVTTSLFVRRLAMNAATHVVEHDLAVDPAQRRLLTEVAPDETGEDAVRAQLVVLFRRLYGQSPAPTDASIDEAHAIFAAVAQRGDPALAWKITLAALLQDLHIIYY